jgi:hypothetical protein
MASYASYKKVKVDSIPDGALSSDNLEPGAGHNLGVQWIFNDRGFRCHQCANNGDCCEQANGRCCLWTVPSNVSTVTFEIWSGGGGGAGGTCANCCMYTISGQGGNYAIKTIETCPGCQYTICAGGTWRCEKSHTCNAGMGCRSYVNGHNLSNFCVTGGCGGWMCNADAWGIYDRSWGCANCNICGIFGADMGMMGDSGMRYGNGYHHCRRRANWTGAAPIIGKRSMNSASEVWCVCGCYTNWPAGGGQSGENSYYDSSEKCCAAGGQGGSGVVRITFM